MAYCPFLSQVLFDSSGNYIDIHYVDCLGDQCSLWDSNNSQCLILSILDKATNIELQISDMNSQIDKANRKVPKAAVLLQEYQGGQDLDDNNKIYGKDFKIDETDENIPKLLLTIQSQSDFPDVPEVWTWQEYLDSLT